MKKLTTTLCSSVLLSVMASTAYADNSDAVIQVQSAPTQAASQTPTPEPASSQPDAIRDEAEDIVGASAMRDQMFSATMDSIDLKMTPEEIIRFKKLIDSQQRAAAQPIKDMELVNSQITMDTSPGAEIPVIRTAEGNVSTLIFLDRYGQPWPISFIKPGGSKFEIKKVLNDSGLEEQKDMSSAITIVPNGYYNTNISLFLKGMSTPLIFKVVTGKDKVDSRVDVRVNTLGPASKSMVAASNMARSNSFSQELPTYDSALLSILGGVAPEGFHHKRLKNRLGDSYWKDGKMYLVTAAKVTRPNSRNNKIMKSGDGTFIYEVDEVSLALFLINGKLEEVEVK